VQAPQSPGPTVPELRTEFAVSVSAGGIGGNREGCPGARIEEEVIRLGECVRKRAREMERKYGKTVAAQVMRTFGGACQGTRGADNLKTEEG
jgi:hypothetical protein